jgi:hypothetical protein
MYVNTISLSLSPRDRSLLLRACSCGGARQQTAIIYLSQPASHSRFTQYITPTTYIMDCAWVRCPKRNQWRILLLLHKKNCQPSSSSSSSHTHTQRPTCLPASLHAPRARSVSLPGCRNRSSSNHNNNRNISAGCVCQNRKRPATTGYNTSARERERERDRDSEKNPTCFCIFILHGQVLLSRIYSTYVSLCGKRRSDFPGRIEWCGGAIPPAGRQRRRRQRPTDLHRRKFGRKRAAPVLSFLPWIHPCRRNMDAMSAL